MDAVPHRPNGTLNATALLVLTLVMVLQIADVITTEICLRGNTGGHEANPLVNKLVDIGGWPFAYTIKLSAILVLCLWCIHRGIPLHFIVAQSAIGPVNNIAYLIEHKL